MKSFFLCIPAALLFCAACSVISTHSSDGSSTTYTRIWNFFDSKANVQKISAAVHGTNLDSKIGEASSEANGSNATRIVVEVVGAAAKTP